MNHRICDILLTVAVVTIILIMFVWECCRSLFTWQNPYRNFTDKISNIIQE